jgi:hypothetical protein
VTCTDACPRVLNVGQMGATGQQQGVVGQRFSSPLVGSSLLRVDKRNTLYEEEALVWMHRDLIPL